MNPYESPQVPSEPRALLTQRIKDWLVDRITLVGCGCLVFVIVWGGVMLISFVFGSRW